MRVTRRGLFPSLCAIVAAICLSSAASAENVVLTVTNSRLEGPTATITYTRTQLRALDSRMIRTRTEFTDGVKEFVGPRLSEVLDRIGNAGATTARMIAANDYAVDIDIAEIRRYDAIIAMEMDGKQLSLRDKGPLWVMYPLDDFIELQDPAYNSRLIWQLTRIVLR